MYYAETAARQIEFHDVDWKVPQDIVHFCRSAWERRPDEQLRAEMLSELAEAWYDGNHYLLHDTSFRLAPVPNPSRRHRVVFNLFAPHLDQYIAKLGMDALNPEAVPQSGSLADIDAARLQTAVCRYYKELLDLDRIKSDMIRRMALGGTAFTKITWDPSKGTEFLLDSADLEALGAEFDPDEYDDGTGFALATGEVCISNVSLCNITWGPIGVPFDQAEWVLEANERSITYAKGRWNLKDEEIDYAYRDAQHRYYHGLYTGSGTVLEPNRQDRVLVYELWVPRSPLHPEGRHAVVVGNKVVNRRNNRKLSNPYQHGRVPYVDMYALEKPNRMVGKSPAWDMFQPQSAINKLASQIMENFELMANPRMWVRETEPINEWELSNRPGGIHRYRDQVPEMMEGTTMPSTVYAILDRWIRVLQGVIGMNDPSMGKAPAQGRSGRFVLALQDADNTRLAPTAQRLARWGQDVFRMILHTVRQYVTEERVIAIRGSDNMWERRAFNGQALTPQSTSSGPEMFNISLRTSGQARSRAAQIELATMLVQFGFFNPEKEEDRRHVFQILELGDISHHYDERLQHRHLQRRVHERLLRGQYVAPAYYHNHDERLAELRRFQATAEYEAQPEEVKQLFRRYEQDTIALQATRQLETQAVAQQAVAEFQANQAESQFMQGMQRMLAGPQGPRTAALLQGALQT